jgi:hypothetical protein
VALVGCGGRDGPSREAFAAEAQEICARAAAITAPLERQVREAARLSEPEQVFERTEDLQRRLAAESARIADRLEAAEHDDEDDELHAWLATLRRARVAREKLADAYRDRDLEAIARTAAARDRLGQQADAWARRTGMPACAAVT